MIVRLLWLVTAALTYASAADWSKGSEPVSVARFPTDRSTEGVVVDRSGNVYVSHADTISRVTPAGDVALWAKLPSPNGHKVLTDGRHLVCDRGGAVYLLDADGKVIKNSATLPWLASTAGVGEEVEVRIKRRGRIYSIQITMEPLPRPSRI